MNLPPATAADRFAALESAASAENGVERFYALVDLAKVAFEAGSLDKATAYAQELSQMAPQFPKDWNYGNAIYYGHFVMGRVALRRWKLNRGKLDEWIGTIRAGGTPDFGANLNY